jgi:outer membrane murein-binding lipoprotein Lpp
MEQVAHSSDNRRRHLVRSSLLIAATVIALIVLSSGAILFEYKSQHAQVNTLAAKNDALDSKINALNKQLQDAKVAGNVSTSGWKTFCDPHDIFCFQYPPNWNFTPSYSPQSCRGSGIESVTATNPTKTVSLNYSDYRCNDDAPSNFFVHSVDSLPFGNGALALVGGYYITSVRHVPMYTIANPGTKAGDLMLTTKQGDIANIAAAPVFLYNQQGFYDLNIYGPSFLTTQQADAWFGSIEGKTAYQIAHSLYIKP